jgi:hypothetical protein
MRKRKDEGVSLAPPAPIRAWLRDVAAGGDPPLPAFGTEESLWEELVHEIALNVATTRAVLRDAERIARDYRPLPDFVKAAELTLAEAVRFSAWVDQNPVAAAAALPGILAALSYKSWASRLDAFLSRNHIKDGMRARADSQRGARLRSKNIRETAHPAIVDAMREVQQSNEGKKRPLSFHNAAIEVSTKLQKPGGTGGSYTVRHIERVSKKYGVHWK